MSSGIVVVAATSTGKTDSVAVTPSAIRGSVVTTLTSPRVGYRNGVESVVHVVRQQTLQPGIREVVMISSTI